MPDSTAAALLGDNGTPAAPAAGVQPTAQPAPNSVWTAAFDEDTNAYVSNKGWKEPSDLLMSYRNLEKFAGGAKNLLELPPEDASPDALEAFYTKLGRPANPDEYGFKVPEGGSPEMVEWFKSAAHKHGLNTKQAQSLFNEFNGMSGSMQEKFQAQMAQESEKAIGSLKQEWGQAYDQMIGAGRRAATALGYDAGKLSAIEDKLGTAEMLRLFLPEGSNEARLVDRIDAHVAKIVELGFLRRLRGQDESLYEVRRILKAFVDAQWLNEFDQRLGEYAGQHGTEEQP